MLLLGTPLYLPISPCLSPLPMGSLFAAGSIIQIIRNAQMNAQEFSCCICKKLFSEGSQPRMMPYCEHSACTACLKHFISKKKPQAIVCQHCGHEQKITQVDLQYFPKNICLTKLLKQKGNVLNNSGSNQQQSSRDTISSTSTNQNELELCPDHRKEMELICVNDRTKLCPHCALFGGHKDHTFKTLAEVGQFMDSTYLQFQSYKSRKTELDARINSNEFKDGIIKKIGQEKDRIVYEIKKKFAEITENVKLAQKKAYEDVVKNFKLVYGKITALMKEENDSLKKYKQWEAKCAEYFQKAEKTKRIEDKVALYYGGPLEACAEGEAHLKRLEMKINSNITNIETLISQIKIVENSGISNSVFNYINVVLEDTDLEVLGYVHQEVISPREFKEQARKDHKIEFGADHLTAERDALSPIPRKKSKSKDIASKLTASDKRSSGKVLGSPDKSERGTVNSLVQDFCERQNLDTLDLTGYSLSDIQIYEVLAYLKPIKKIKGLKLVKNRLSNQGLMRIIDFMPLVTNINLSFNQLGDESILILLNNRSKIPYLRIINLSNNKINERKTKNAIDELKKQGVIVTI